MRMLLGIPYVDKSVLSNSVLERGKQDKSKLLLVDKCHYELDVEDKCSHILS
ncbi:hypothetical protein AXX17_AT4G27960 [Arabidopsis thaliana]|uniref:Uncharacterized protein n=1 Tax=Arabidopsis thaliana TaxID=3702 RepID=A0A178UZC9_ARATH|nr:hypothetical protein AXX17_AT4G27960 [Arabidopsis thaliana]